MILVNNPGNGDYVFSQVNHVPWHGWTFADLIAPCFLWVIGVTTVLSLSRGMETNNSRLSIMLHVLRRSAILFLVGMGLEVFQRLFPPYDPSFLNALEFMGILQRIAICYVLGSAIFLASGTRGQIGWTVILLLV
jgi:predicted acyltransferase